MDTEIGGGRKALARIPPGVKFISQIESEDFVSGGRGAGGGGLDLVAKVHDAGGAGTLCEERLELVQGDGIANKMEFFGSKFLGILGVLVQELLHPVLASVTVPRQVQSEYLIAMFRKDFRVGVPIFSKIEKAAIAGHEHHRVAGEKTIGF